MTTTERIRPAIHETYGESNFAEALVDHLAQKIDEWDSSEHTELDFGEATRHDMIRMTCWNWFSGGGTAEIAARRVELLLEP